VPELPEVETIRRQLAPSLEGRRIERLEILDPRWCAPVAAGRVEQAVAGCVIEGLSRRGKYLVWELECERAVVMHLRMTGTLLLARAGEPTERPHLRVRAVLDSGAAVLFCDPRRFGTGVVLEGRDGLEAHLAPRVGIEPLGPGFTAEALWALARGRRAPVKAFLLSQDRVAGVGNIYADEALHRAGIHPLRPVGTLRRAQIAALRDAVVGVLEAGIAAKGATIDDFRHADGARGSFQDLFQVHRRAGEPCPRCASPVRKLRAAGRGTYVCERCQPRPRPRRVRRTTPAGAQTMAPVATRRSTSVPRATR
jgi:formamidopyrimidine-DNA glycosylase